MHLKFLKVNSRYVLNRICCSNIVTCLSMNLNVSGKIETSFSFFFSLLDSQNLKFTWYNLVPRRSLLAHTTWREISWRHRMAYRENA